jgi:hypothetical protein
MKNPKSKYLVDLIICEDGTAIERVELLDKFGNFIWLPKNDLNIKYLSYDLITCEFKDGNIFEITYEFIRRRKIDLKAELEGLGE